MSGQPRFALPALCAVLGAVAVSLLALAPGAQAGTIAVSTTFDDLAGNSACSLREAIEVANDDADSGGCTDANAALPDTIVLGGGDYELSRVGALDDTNLNGDLDISADLTIQGIGAEATGIDGNGGVTGDRVLDVLTPGPLRTVNLSGLTVHDGSSTGDGGGIDADNGSVLNLTSTDVSGNAAVDDGGGIGGQVNANAVNLTDSTVSDNVADDHSGGIAGSSATLTNSAVTGNAAGTAGGGIRAALVSLTNSRVSGNEAATDGGGIQAVAGFSGSGDVTLVGSRVSNNTAGAEGGGINTTDATVTDSTVSGNDAGTHGGGIFTDDGSVTVTRSTINGNNAGTNGGGILFSPAVGETLNVTNSTLSGNQAKQAGGGISADETVNLSNATITDNTADSDFTGGGSGGGIAQFAPATVSLKNTILGGNRDPSGPGSDCSGTLNSQGYNFIGDTVNCTVAGVTTGNIGGPSPQLDPLGANGGPTLTHALMPIANALDAGYPGTGAGQPCEATDQRGLPRGGGAGRCDIGAFEGQPPPVGPGAVSPAAIPPTTPAVSPPATKKCKKPRKLKKGRCVKKKRK